MSGVGERVHPIEYRYGCEELRRILSVQNLYKTMAWIEYLVVRAQEKRGLVPKGTSEALRRSLDEFSIDAVFEEERITRHDIMALINVLARKMGELGEWLHIGLTSEDLRDTAKMVVIKDSMKIIKRKLLNLLEKLADLAEKYMNLPCVARTHGIHANVYLFGRKFAVFAEEFLRHWERIQDLEKRLYVGKISGAVGIHTGLGELGEEIEAEVLSELGLKPDRSAVQIISRDILAELFLLFANISSSLDKLATEIRNLQRTEIAEVEEEFIETQIGSTAMPHKRNPIAAENVSSLAKILRSLTIAALENIITWHERDLTNSGAERILIPEAFLILDEQLDKMIRILSRLKVDTDKVRENLNMTKGLIFSEILANALALKGYGRARAYMLVRELAMKAHETKETFMDLVLSNHIFRQHFKEEELKQLFEPEPHLAVAKKMIRETINKVRAIKALAAI
ncbi:MAG: adenylosuccinate lyase [Crenarchaeota archaeon]|nr:adenylosuccinate lyase [Thermoproteota archaeon]MCR8455474.1 adenylosuccinate lyase [Thermoproteota archaeon]